MGRSAEEDRRVRGLHGAIAALWSFCDAGTLAEVKQFFASRKVPEAERTLQQATERISACAALAAQQSGKLGAWLSEPVNGRLNRAGDQDI